MSYRIVSYRLTPEKTRRSTTRCVSRNPVNRSTTVWTSCTTNRQKVEVVELEGYSRPTCNKLCASGRGEPTVVGMIHKLDDGIYRASMAARGNPIKKWQNKSVSTLKREDVMWMKFYSRYVHRCFCTSSSAFAATLCITLYWLNSRVS